MSDISHFESRSGKVTSPSQDVFAFVTDIRNFEQFIPEGKIQNWQADRDSCSFSVSMVGTVSLRITQKKEFDQVIFNGDALNKNDFELVLNITGNNNDQAEVKIYLNADLNPVMKMVASKPIAQFLEMLIVEMEKIKDWRKIKE